MERTKKQNFTGTKSQEEKIQELKANYDYISGIKKYLNYNNVVVLFIW